MSRMTRPLAGAAVLAAAALLAAGCGSGFSSSNKPASQQSGPASLQILIASSGDAETAAVKQAAATWAASSGNKATVVPAQNIDQQLGQAFAGSKPPDVFYMDAAKVADYVPKQWAVQLGFFIVVGLGWGVPILPLISWMNRGR